MNKALLIGSPNSGKSTLFNWITGKRQKVVNFPGSTVDFALGTSMNIYGESLQIYDTPGTYSLEPQTPEEEVTTKLLFNQGEDFNCIIAVIDMTQIYRQAPLVKQLKKMGRPVVIALTMQDLYRKKNSAKVDSKTIDVEPLIEMFEVPVVAVDGILGQGVKELIEMVRSQVQRDLNNEKIFAWTVEEQVEALAEAKAVSDKIALKNKISGEDFIISKRTEFLDQILLSRFFGPIIFLVLMALVFSSIFWLSVPLMDLMDEGFAGLAGLSRQLFGQSLFSDFLADGVIGSFAAVLVFVPQIFILFFVLSILEESGYLARAATLADKPLSWFGLSGRSFIPLLSGFACAVPAVMSARGIPDKKIKWLTVFVIPFMTCSARLPVYALLLSFLFYKSGPFLPGLLLAALYFGGLIISLVTTGILNSFIKTKSTSFHILELPYYRWPRWSKVIHTSYLRSRSYVKKAGPIIFIFAVIIWSLATFPISESGETGLKESYISQMGKWIEPVVEPMGADWRVGVGLISAFAAREVFVSSLAVIFNITESDDEVQTQDQLLQKMRSASNSSGQPLFNTASIAALLIFFMIALQCMSTVGIVYKEMESWKYAAGQLVFMNLLGYVLAVLTYQLLI